MHFLWIHFTVLPWWGMPLWSAYTIYFIIRAVYIWQETREEGLWKGYKYVFFGYKPKYFRLYHLIRMVFDIPPSILGLLFPIIRAIFRLKIYEFKEQEAKTPTH